MADNKILPQYMNLYNQLYAKLNTGYTPQSASTLKDSLARAMRPSYDRQISARQDTAAANRAAIDADATSRGMGSSSWVTDVKNRQRNAEASDIANINSDYNANLHNALLNRLGQQDEMALSASQAAQGNALNLANALYDRIYKPTGGAVSSRGRGHSPKTEPESSPNLNGFGEVKPGKEYTPGYGAGNNYYRNGAYYDKAIANSGARHDEYQKKINSTIPLKNKRTGTVEYTGKYSTSTTSRNTGR